MDGGWLRTIGTAVSSIPQKLHAGWRWLRPLPASLEEGIGGLREVRDQIRAREAALLGSVDLYRVRAAACAARDDARGARLAIKLQLMHDRQLATAQQTLVAIEAHIMALENAVMNQAVVSALQHGAVALGRPPDEDHVDDLLLTLEEQSESTQNIMRTLSTAEGEVAEEAVEAELERLCAQKLPQAEAQAEAQADLPQAELTQAELPQAPHHALPSTETAAVARTCLSLH